MKTNFNSIRNGLPADRRDISNVSRACGQEWRKLSDNQKFEHRLDDDEQVESFKQVRNGTGHTLYSNFVKANYHSVRSRLPADKRYIADVNRTTTVVSND